MAFGSYIFIVPIFRLVSQSFSGEEVLTLAYYQEIFSNSTTWTVLKNTMVLILVAGILAVIAGVSFAWLMAYTDIRFKRIIELFIYLPFVIPSYVMTLAWVQFFGNNGMLSRFAALFGFQNVSWNLYSMSGMIVVMAVSVFPLVYMFTVNNFRQIPRESELAARISGANHWQTFMKVTVPMGLPGIVGGSFIAFLAYLDNFGIPAFLGTPANISVLTTYIYQQVIGFGSSAFNRAAVLSVILGIIALSGNALQWWVLRKSNRLETNKIDLEPRVFLGKKRGLVEILIFVFILFTTILPLLSMFLSPFIRAYGLDFVPENFSLKHYEYVLTSRGTTDAIKVSLRLAGFTAVFSLLAGTLFAYCRVRRANKSSKLMESAITIPYALPGTVFALSMIFAWMQPLPGCFPGIYGSITILYIAYVTRFMILQVRSGITAFQQVDISVEEAAQISGTNGWGKWHRVLIPLISPTVFGGMILVFLSALTELTVSSLLYSSNSETIGVSILSLQQSGYTLYATAFSSLIVTLIILCYLLVLVLTSLWNRKVG